jgi:DNA-damage-inducible protein J
MAQSSLLQVRLDTELKSNAERLFNEIGLDMPSAIRLFLKQSLVKGGVPFPIDNKRSRHDKQELYRLLEEGLEDFKNGDTLTEEEMAKVLEDL